MIRSAFNAVIETPGTGGTWDQLEVALGKTGAMFKTGSFPAKLVFFAKSFDSVRDPVAVEAIARISSMERARVVASINDVTASILSWTPFQKRRFGFIWHEINTWKSWAPSSSTSGWGERGFDEEQAAGSRQRMATTSTSHLSENQKGIIMAIVGKCQEQKEEARVISKSRKKVASSSSMTVADIFSLCKSEGLLLAYDRTAESIHDLAGFGLLKEASESTIETRWTVTKLAIDFVESERKKQQQQEGDEEGGDD